MSIHFNTRAEAEAHLTGNGFRQIKNGNWVTTNGVAAHILLAHGEVVLVQFWEVGA